MVSMAVVMFITIIGMAIIMILVAIIAITITITVAFVTGLVELYIGYLIIAVQSFHFIIVIVG